MNLFKKTMMAAGMASVALVPVAATAASPVASIASARVAPASGDDSQLRGREGRGEREGKIRGGTGIILGILAAALIIVGIVIAVDSNNNDRPVSP